MHKAVSLAATLIVATIFISGCEHDDDPSGTATVMGNIRTFDAPHAIAESTPRGSVAGITIELRLTDGSYTASNTSAADGTFTFTDVPTGDFELVLTGGGLTGNLAFTVTEGSTVELVDIIVEADGATRHGAIVKSEPVTETTASPTETSTPAPAPKVQWLDQKQTTGGSGAYFLYTGRGLGQVFTVGATNGSIFKVEVDIWSARGASSNVTVTIRSTDPNGAILGTATIAGASITGRGALETALFTPTIPVSAGSKYAIVCTTTEPSATYWNWDYSGAVYAGGTSWQEFPPGGGTFIQNAALYKVFRVWLEK